MLPNHAVDVDHVVATFDYRANPSAARAARVAPPSEIQRELWHRAAGLGLSVRELGPRSLRTPKARAR